MDFTLLNINIHHLAIQQLILMPAATTVHYTNAANVEYIGQLESTRDWWCNGSA